MKFVYVKLGCGKMISCPEKKYCDMLLVTNQNHSLDEMIELVSSNETCIILTTHQLFPFEIAKFSEYKVSILSFSDFLTDEEMEQIDNMALASFKNSDSSKDEFTAEFMSRSIRIKNYTVCRKIISKYSFNKIFCYDGLGIDQDVWIKFAAAKPLCNIKEKHSGSDEHGILYRTAAYGFRFLRSIVRKIKIEYVEYAKCENYLFCFPKGIKRINFQSDVQIGQIKLRRIWLEKLLSVQNPAEKLKFCRTISVQLKSPISKVYICSTIHNYCKHSDFVFQDGYLPSNYTRTYYEYFKCKYFAQNYIFTTNWLQQMNFNPVFLPRLVKIPFFTDLVGQIDFKKNRPQILLALNHAGDWSALINRSDTEKILTVFCSVALKNPKFDFTVRCHPGMNHPLHEGINSSKRIEKYIDSLGAENLAFSKNSLEQDLEKSDLVIGEYTNVLLTCFNQGIAGLIVNLTNRRSFMKDFEDIGFFSINSADELERFFNSFEDSFSQLIVNNNKAIRKFNELQCQAIRDKGLTGFGIKSD